MNIFLSSDRNQTQMDPLHISHTTVT